MSFVQHNSCISLAEIYGLNHILISYSREEIETIYQNGKLNNTGIMLNKRYNKSFERYISANEIIEFETRKQKRN